MVVDELKMFDRYHSRGEVDAWSYCFGSVLGGVWENDERREMKRHKTVLAVALVIIAHD